MSSNKGTGIDARTNYWEPWWNFLGKWCSKSKQLSLSLMKDNVQFCNEKVEETTAKLKK